MKSITVTPKKLFYDKTVGTLCFESVDESSNSFPYYIDEIGSFTNNNVSSLLGNVIQTLLNEGKLSYKKESDVQVLIGNVFFSIKDKEKESVDKVEKVEKIEYKGDINKFHNVVVDYIKERLELIKTIKTYNDFYSLLCEHSKRIKETDDWKSESLFQGHVIKWKETNEVFKAIAGSEFELNDFLILPFMSYQHDDIIEKLILKNSIHFNNDVDDYCFIVLKSGLKGLDKKHKDWCELVTSNINQIRLVTFEKMDSCVEQKQMESSELCFCDLVLFIDLFLLFNYKPINGEG